MALLLEELSEPKSESVPELSCADLLTLLSLPPPSEALRSSLLSLELENFLFFSKLRFLLDFDLS